MITFQPALPDWKASAIQKLGFGNLNKVLIGSPSSNCKPVWLLVKRACMAPISIMPI